MAPSAENPDWWPSGQLAGHIGGGQMNLANIDMNLLKVLNVLIEERSVTRAGERLGRTQSAVSNALRRLRRMLNDDILVRESGSSVLTARAQALRQPLRDLMRLAEVCLTNGASFDAATAPGVFRIGLPDRLCLLMFPLLVKHLIKMAPNMSIHVVTTDRKFAFSLLDDETIDIALVWIDKVPSHFRSEPLFDDERVCICRSGHPILRGPQPLDVNLLMSFPHVVVSATGGREAIFDSWLAKRGLSRRTLVSVSNFSAVPYLLEQTDTIGVFTRRVSEVFKKKFKLEIVPLPFAIDPLSNHMLWHARDESDPKHLWFRQQIKRICNNL